MSGRDEFAQQIEARLAAADREPFWKPAEAEKYMADISARRQQFERAAAHVKETVVLPRLETLASYFVNASVPRDEAAGIAAVCRFGFCERFPASARVEVLVEHDARFEKIAVVYDAWMMPLFVKFNQHDAITAPLHNVDGTQIASWLEERLLEYLDAYLRIDRGRNDFDDEGATDPVCGMRIARSAAAAKEVYVGHAYFFCSVDCQKVFVADPQSFVKVKTM